MNEIFIKHKITIFRTLGVLMLVVGFVIHFWATPKKVLTQNEIAAKNVARIEARIAREQRGETRQKKESSSSEILKHLKDTQAAQQQYLTIFSMLLGIGFLGYSFVKKKED